MWKIPKIVCISRIYFILNYFMGIEECIFYCTFKLEFLLSSSFSSKTLFLLMFKL